MQNFQDTFETHKRSLSVHFQFAWLVPLKRYFDRTAPVDCFLFLSVHFEEFCFLFYFMYWLFHVQVAEFHPGDTVKNYFTGAFRVYYTLLCLIVGRVE